MSRRSKEKLAVQLFPFLAVLVCTMGALIFLLLVTTRQIRQRAVAFAAHQLALQMAAEAEVGSLPSFAESEPEEPPAVVVIPPQPVRVQKPVKVPDQSHVLALAERERDLKQLATKWKLQVSQLSKDREDLQSALTRQKELFGRSVEDTMALKVAIDKLELQLDKLSGEVATVSVQTPDDAARTALEQQIAELKKRLRAAEAVEDTDTEKFQVVPFDPLTGTTRHPIFIECTEAGLRFLPEDITLTPADLAGFTHRINPLAAGAGALINYWIAWNLNPRRSGEESEPYILLLVRPNGVCAYYVALQMLEPIRTAHGYELIEESTVLQLPEVDPGAKAACEAAVERLLSERETIYRSALRDGAGSTVFGGSLRGTGSGGGKGSGASGGTYAERLAGARRSGANGFTVADVTGEEGNGERDARSWERVENFKGRPRSKGADDSYDGPTSGAADSPLSGLPAGKKPSRSEKASESAGTAGSSDGSAGQGSKSADSENSKSSGFLNGLTGRVGRHGKRNSAGDAAITSTGGVPEMPVGERPGKKKRSQSDSADSSADGEGDEMEGVADADDNGQGGPGSHAQAGDGGSSGLSDNRSSPPRFSNGAKLSGSTPDRHPRRSSDLSNKTLEPEMLAGRRWGFSEPSASIGFEREVRVDVFEDKLVIAEKYVVNAEKGESKQELFEQFASTLDRYSHEWGRPPQGFFWTPRLKFVVKPEANANYEQVNEMMTRAGVSTTHEFTKDKAKLEFGRQTAPSKPATKTGAKQSAGGNR